MNFLKNIFKAKEEPIRNYADFWEWFQKKEKDFFYIVRTQRNLEKGFFDKLSSRLGELKDGYYYLTGMYDDNTVELVLTADGITKNIVFVEELVQAAPTIAGWKFTALKPPLDIKDVGIEMAGYKFNGQNISFYANELKDYPDEIDITIVHTDLTDDNKAEITNGIYIFLDNYLGELDFANNVDRLSVVSNQEAKKELVPIAKLKDYLTWRQKEFIEKYEGIRYHTENDSCRVLEAELESGDPLIAVINTELLNWDRKASHPWISTMILKYDGSKRNGLPDKNDYSQLDDIEKEIMQELKDADGYLNIGRQTAENEREIYFACKDFRKPSKVFFEIQKKYADRFEIRYEIFKDKYWQIFERFNKRN